ncbi:MAG TPA: esterase-like activity of phytase family protein [Vicinamibacteria bacterium]|nr:esterase-like activity of phytase family protein [Vicinamibacteria bacterium]
MNVAVTRSLLGVAVVAGFLAVPRAGAEVKLLGTGVIPGTATDNTGLTRTLEDGVTPENLIGGLGSAIAWTGVGDLYVATPDRGPADGATTYSDRAYLVRVRVRRAGNGSYSVTPWVLDTRLLKSERRRVFTGSAAAFDPTNSPDSVRLDPEGVRVANCGASFFVSDEYGPFLYEFGPNGRRKRSIALPTKLLVDYPSANPTDELKQNAFGRQANRGMEGLAISPDGTKLYGILQSPLIQDGGLGGPSGTSRVGTNVRIVEVDLKTGGFREFLYTLDKTGYGVSEILAVNDHELLVLERDGTSGLTAVFKRVFKIDISEATDIRGLKQLPSTGVPAGVVPVSKAPFLDLLAALGVNSGTPEKFEGLAFGPDLHDGRHQLLVTVDNDFKTTQGTAIYAFAIDPGDLPDYEPQAFGSCACEEDHDHEREHGQGW